MATDFGTIRELIYWEYAKLIAKSATGSGNRFGFVQYSFRRLKAGASNPSAILRENKRVAQSGDRCAYCGRVDRLQWEHIIPRAVGSPDSFDNMVRACRERNLAKGKRDPYQWYGLERAHQIPTVVLAKFLKLVLARHQDAGTADLQTERGVTSDDRLQLSAIFSASPLV